MEFFSLWDEAASDLEAEKRERAVHTANLASEGVWTFLAAAKSEPEFETRLALAETNLSTVAAESGLSVEDITEIMRRRYALLVEASSNPFAKDDDDEDGDDDDDSDGDDSGGDGDDSDDDGDDSSDDDDSDSDGDDSDSDDSDDSGDSDDSDGDDDEGNPFAKSSAKSHEELDSDFDKAFADLKDAGLEHDADHPIAERYRAASDAVNHSNRKRDYGIATGQITSAKNEGWVDPHAKVYPAGSKVFVPHFMGEEELDGQKGFHARVIAPPGEHGYADRSEEHLMQEDNGKGNPFFHHFGSRQPSLEERTAALKAEILSGVDPLSPEFGKEAWAKAITMAAPAVIDMVKGDKEEEPLPTGAPSAAPSNPMDAAKGLKEKGKAVVKEVLAGYEEDTQYGGRYRKPESLDVFDSNDSIQHYTPKHVDPEHSPDAGQVHITNAKNSRNGKHNVMVIDAGGNSQWPTRYDDHSLGFDNPDSIVTPREHIHSAFDHAEELDKTLGTHKRSARIAALKEEILSGVDPLSPEFGKTALPAALPLLLRAAPMAAGLMGGGKSEGADEGDEPEGVLEEGAESSRLPFDHEAARDWNGETTPTEFCNELKKYDDLWNTGGREHDSGCPVHGGPNADEAFSSWKDHVSKQSSKTAAGSTCPNCGSDKALVAIPQGPNLKWVCQEPGCGWSGAPGSAPMNRGDVDKVASGSYARNPQGNPDLGWIEDKKMSPDEAEKHRLFPDGIPMRGELTPEQQAWMDKGRKKKAGAAADLAATTNTGGIPQASPPYGGSGNQATTKPRQQPSGGPGGITGPAGPSGPDGGIAGPGSPGDDNMPSGIENFNPSSNGGDAKAGMDDMPSSDAPTTKDAVLVRVAREHPELSDEQVEKVATLVAESSGLQYMPYRSVGDSNWTTNMGKNLSQKPDLTTKVEDKIKGRVQPKIDQGKKKIDTQKQQLVKKVKDKVQPPEAPGYDYDPSDAPDPVDLSDFDKPMPGMQSGPKHRGEPSNKKQTTPGRHRAASLEDDMPLLLG